MIDVLDLGEFYSTRLGGLVRRMVGARVAKLKPPPAGGHVMGFGYAQPYLRPFLKDAGGVFSFAPAQMGVTHWPRGEKGLTALVDDTALPLDDGVIDFALIAHGLEFAVHTEAMLGEIWRVLAGQGRAIFIVPNRRGLWARFDSTPFGHGYPFSRMQMTRLFRNTDFIPVNWSQALFLPPFERRFLLRSGPAIERLGQWAVSGLGGVMVIEVTKQVYSISPSRKPRLELEALKPQGAVARTSSLL